MHLSPLARLTLAASLLAPQVAAQGNTWIVDDELGPDVDATSVQDALALASDGDLILLRPGALDPFVIDGLSITVQGDSNGTVLPEFEDPAPEPAITVRNLGPGQSVVLRDLTVFQFGTSAPAIDVRDNLGAVALDGLFVDFLGGATGIHVEDSASLALNDVFVQIAHLRPDGVGATDCAGIDALRSNVFVHDSIVGGAAGFSSDSEGNGASDGAAAIRLRGSSLTASATEIHGGDGGSVFIGCHAPGDGGTGLIVDQDLGAPSLVRLQQVNTGGGSGGFQGVVGCTFPGGSNGAPLDLVAGSTTTLPGAPRFLSAPAQVAPNSTLELNLEGQVNDLVVLVAGTQPLPGLFLPGSDVSLHVVPTLLAPLGALKSTTETRSVPTPALPASVEFVGVELQGLFLGGDGEVFLTGPTGSAIL